MVLFILVWLGASEKENSAVQTVEKLVVIATADLDKFRYNG